MDEPKKRAPWLCNACVEEISKGRELWEYTISPVHGHCERCGKHDFRRLIGEGQWDESDTP